MLLLKAVFERQQDMNVFSLFYNVGNLMKESNENLDAMKDSIQAGKKQIDNLLQDISKVTDYKDRIQDEV